MTYPFNVKKGKLHKRLGVAEDQPIPLKTVRADLEKQRKRVAHKATHAQALEELREDQFAINAHHFRHRGRKPAV